MRKALDFESQVALTVTLVGDRRNPVAILISRDERMAVRATKVELVGFGDDRREAWKSLSISCQRMTNRIWQIWLCHHAMNRSAEKMKNFLDELDRIRSQEIGAKPVRPSQKDVLGIVGQRPKSGVDLWKKRKAEVYRDLISRYESDLKKWDDSRKAYNKSLKSPWPCSALEEPLTASADQNSFYRILSREFANVNVRTRGLLLNAWQSKISKRKAATGNLPGWLSILFANESMPSCTRPQPIPFDKENAKLQKVSDKYLLELRIDRLEDGKSVVEKCELLLNKKKCWSVRSIVDRIISGEYSWKGSSLVYDRGKWFASLSYDRPPVVRQCLDPNKILYVRPAKNTPWRVSVGGFGSWVFGGNGSHVEHARRAIIGERNSRKANYRWASSSQKGSGRKRATSAWTKLSSRWKFFVKRYNNELTAQLVKLAVSRSCGRIVYIQPKDSDRDDRCLTIVGNDADSSKRGSMTWDYFQFGSMLAAKCEMNGIEYGSKDRAAVSGV